MDKFTSLDGIDPLSKGTPSTSVKKDKPVSKLEETLRASEKTLLGNALPNEVPLEKKGKSQGPILFTPSSKVEGKFPFGVPPPQKVSDPTGLRIEDIAEQTKKAAATEDESWIKPTENEVKLEEIGFNKNDIMPGEKFLAQCTASVTTPQYPKLGIDGNIVITKYRFVFFPSDPNYNTINQLRDDYFMVPLSFITKIEKITLGEKKMVYFLEIFSKDGRQFKFRVTEKRYNDTQPFLIVLDKFVFVPPTSKDLFFASEFAKANKTLDDIYGGWNILDIKKEFARQGLKVAPEGVPNTTGEFLYRYVDNKAFKLCSTYPPTLVVPAKATDNMLNGSAKFRSRERLPVITYYHAPTKAVIARCSQCKSGITQNRSADDEFMLRLIGNPHYNPDYQDVNFNPNSKGEKPDVNVHIYDARPYLNAVANRVNGKGYEEPKFYRNCEIFFMDIENIHHVRDSMKKVLNLCYSNEVNTSKWLSKIEDSGWLQVIAFILNAAVSVVNSVLVGKGVLIHCSDGWDRAGQIAALAQLLLDPYFRTIEGFEVLIEKDFVNYGHQFQARMGHGVKIDKDDQRSPIFIQFIDCVQQILHQFPYAFEFNKQFLFDILYHAHTCQFGTFLCNHVMEQTEQKIKEKTVSLWSYINASKDKYLNIYFTPVKELIKKKEKQIWRESDPEALKRLLEESIQHNKTKENAPLKLDNLDEDSFLAEVCKQYPDILRPSFAMKHLRLWEEYFLFYSPLTRPLGLLSHQLPFQEDLKEYLLLKKIKELKKEVRDLKERVDSPSIKEIKDSREESKNGEIVRNGEDTTETTTSNEGHIGNGNVKEQIPVDDKIQPENIVDTDTA